LDGKCIKTPGSCPPLIETFDGDDQQIFDKVIALNLHRRHLTQSQRAIIAAEMANIENGKHKRKNDAASPEAACPPSIAQPEAAKALQVSRSTVQRAARVKREAVPEVAEAVKSGAVSVTRAAKIADATSMVSRQCHRMTSRPPDHDERRPRRIASAGRSAHGTINLSSSEMGRPRGLTAAFGDKPERQADSATRGG
jgi:hypothetical protein